MLHRLRSVLVCPGRDRLTGTVEVDETFIGGAEPGLRGGRAKGKKSLVGVAVEVNQPRGYGRCRMEVLTDASAVSLRPFVTGHVEPGARVITDAWQGCSGISTLGYTHDRRSQRAARARGKIPASCCPQSTASPPWPSGGCWAPTRAQPTPRTCRATSTSSCSASTVADPAASGWSSTACSRAGGPPARGRAEGARRSAGLTALRSAHPSLMQARRRREKDRARRQQNGQLRPH
jgi:ISXO2-like transposase domain